MAPVPTAVNTYGRSLLWAQAIAGNEKASAGIISAKQAAYAGIASSLQSKDPGLYPLFQGKEWTTRLEIGFAALFAAVVAGILVLLMSVTLILLKLGFLLLLIAGPLFLLVGTHPGFGRVLALRWVELLIGVLLKQAAVAVVLSVLLYCYALIMGTPNATLGWALKILMIALVTIAAFIYRKPFQHLFSAVGYGVIGSHDQAALDLQRAGASARANSRTAATFAVPGFAAYRAGQVGPAESRSGGGPCPRRGGGRRRAAAMRRHRRGVGPDSGERAFGRGHCGRGGGRAAAAWPRTARQAALPSQRGPAPWRGRTAPSSRATAAEPALAQRRAACVRWPGVRSGCRPEGLCRPEPRRPGLGRARGGQGGLAGSAGAAAAGRRRPGQARLAG